MKKYLLLVLCVLPVLAPKTLVAQRFELGGGIGATHYKGEIYTKFKPLAFNGGANAFFRYNATPSISLKATATAARISADDKRVNNAFHQSRRLYFYTNIIEAGGQVEYNFFNFRLRNTTEQRNYTPYLLAGYSTARLFGTNSIKSVYKVHEGSPQYFFNQYSTEKRKLHFQAITMGFGVKKKLTRNLNLTAEFGARWVNSDDKLDNIGYVLRRNDEGKPLLDADGNKQYISNFAANPSLPITFKDDMYKRMFGTPTTHANDRYYYTNVSISYLFGEVLCPMPQPTWRQRLRKHLRR